MTAAIGVFSLAVGASASVLGISALLAGIRRRDPRLLRLGARCVVGVLVAAIVSVAAMEWALLTHDFSIQYVVDNVRRSTSTLFTITALWGALEGSILLWGLVLAGYLAAVVWRLRHRTDDPLVAWALVTGFAVTLFFFGLMLFAANPFAQVAGAVPADGQGPNPLLQEHPLMAFHPPMLYLGYVGFTVPFMFAIASLVTGRFDEGWVSDTRRVSLFAWGCLTVGIILGGWWSYEVLGWGGYWAWDPVENASLLPWLTGTAFLHSVMVQERRGMLRVWNLSLVIATFCLTILGTFLTRSGIVNSVHAFTQSEIGPALLGFLAVCAAVGVGLIAWRGDTLRSPGRIDAVVSRESAFLANNLVFAGFAFVVLLGTVFPLLAEALQDRQLSVGEPYFDRMTIPLGITLLFLMAVAPLLPWRAASTEVLRDRLLVPAWVGGVTMVAVVVLGARGVANVLVFGLAAFALAGIARVVFVAVRGRRRATGEGPVRALLRTIAGDPRRYGGLLVHVGVVLIAVAIASSGYQTRREVRLEEGESATVAGYTVTYLGSERRESANSVQISASVRLEKDGRDLGVWAPSIKSFARPPAVGTPSVRTGLLEDVYLTIASSPQDGQPIALGVAVKPMILWLWIGGGLMALGTLMALVPAVRRRPRDLPLATPRAGTEPTPPPGGDAPTTAVPVGRAAADGADPGSDPATDPTSDPDEAVRV